MQRLKDFKSFINENLTGADRLADKLAEIEKGLRGVERTLPSTADYRGEAHQGLTGPAVEHAQRLLELLAPDAAGLGEEIGRRLKQVAWANPSDVACDRLLHEYRAVLLELKAKYDALG
jgi:hypothetical protein